VKRKETTLAESVGIIVLMLIVLTGCCCILRINEQMALLFCALFLATYAGTKGYTAVEIEKMAIEGINSVTVALLINLCIGMLISAWISAGTFAYLIDVLIKVLHPRLFLTESFLFCCIISSLIGSCWLCVGTIGLILFSMGQNIGINLGLLMGAILGGARFGASFSPISDTVNISVLLSGVRDVSLHIRAMLAVLAPAAGACSLIYLCIDSCSVRVIEDTKLIDLSELIAEEFYLSPINLLPAVILFAMISLKKSTLLCMLASIITGAVVSIVPQGKSLYAIADILFYGYGGYIRSSEDVINIIFARGGVSSVMGMTITLIIGMSLSGIANHLGLIKRVVNSLTNHVKTSRDAVALSLLFSIVGYGATGDSQPSKVIVGNAFSDIYERYNLERSVLSCSLEMTSFGEVLFPWTAGAVYYFSVFEIPVNRYWYFDFFCFFAILFQIVMGGKQKNIF
jgi:NhaC family Na+:H+ antiporter